MRPRPQTPNVLLLAALLLAPPTVAAQVERVRPTAEASEDENAPDGWDPRSWELLRHECRSDLGRREITLFANGTLRLRESAPAAATGSVARPLEVGDLAHPSRRKEMPGEESMTLVELTPEEREGFAARLAGVELDEAELHYDEVGGDWVERCELRLQPVGGELRRFRYGRFDSLSLPVSRLVAIAEELGRLADERGIGRHLPVGYQARIGDVLERVGGELFRVTGYTADKRGVELQGVDQPLTVYVAVDDLAGEFVAVVTRRDRFGGWER